jgi:sialic acid synthase SpsE
MPAWAWWWLISGGLCPQLAVWAAQSDASFCWQRPIGSVAILKCLISYPASAEERTLPGLYRLVMRCP